MVLKKYIKAVKKKSVEKSMNSQTCSSKVNKIKFHMLHSKNTMYKYNYINMLKLQKNYIAQKMQRLTQKPV